MKVSMGNARYWVLAFFGLWFVVAIGILLQGGLLVDCGETITNRLPSPDGVIEARIVLVNCGATTDYTTMVAVRSPSDTRAVRDDYFFSVKGNGEVRVRWQDERRLVVSAWPGAQTFRKAILWGGLPIDYE